MNNVLFKDLEKLNPSIEELRLMEADMELWEEADLTFYSDDAMKQYLLEISKIPLLSAEEEKELGKVIREGGQAAALEARNKLVEANLRLVVFFAKKYIGSGVELEDLNAMGREGLIRAAQKFDYSLGIRFSTYASWWIKQAITRGVVTAKSLRIPFNLKAKIQKVQRTQEFLTKQCGVDPSFEELAEYLSISEKELLDILAAMYKTVSIDQKVGEDGEATIGDFLADEQADDPYEVAKKKALKEAMGRVLGMLEPKEALVLALRYGMGQMRPMTLEEIANLPQFGVTRERIRQIEKRAIRNIKRSPKMMGLLKEFD